MPPSKRTQNARPLLTENQGDLLEKSFEEQQKARAAKLVQCLGRTFTNDDARREHFLGLLADKLKDPGFRAVEGFPIAEAEDILALSNPPYYTACPNPWLPDFISAFRRPESPTDDSYRRQPFASDVSEGKTGAVYSAHSYHTKVPYLAIKKYIEHFTRPGDIILDGFSGTGMTGVAVSRAGHSRHAILVDLSPAATFISSLYNKSVNPEEFAIWAKQIISAVERTCGAFYHTTDPSRGVKQPFNTLFGPPS